MQSHGCIDGAGVVDGWGWVRDHLLRWGGAPEHVEAAAQPILATRPNDPHLDLILFPKDNGGYAAGVVRFTAHAVVCSAGYWRPNISRDYPGPLCDRLAEAFGCPILFLQGPCGDHRPRHREVGIAERDRIANGLAQALVRRRHQAIRFPFDQLRQVRRHVTLPLQAEVPRSAEEARLKATAARQALAALPSSPDTLPARKALGDQIAFADHMCQVLDRVSYLTAEELEARAAELIINRLDFGPIRLVTFPGELFSTVVAGLAQDAAPQTPTVIASFVDGVTGYLLPPEDLAEGGYEATWALFEPAAVAHLRHEATALLAAP